MNDFIYMIGAIVCVLSIAFAFGWILANRWEWASTYYKYRHDILCALCLMTLRSKQAKEAYHVQVEELHRQWKRDHLQALEDKFCKDNPALFSDERPIGFPLDLGEATAAEARATGPIE